MSNIIEIAEERRAMLLDEIGQLDCFIEMAAQLMKSSQLEPDEVPETENETVEARDKEVNEEPEWPVLEPADVESDFDEDLPTRELKVEEQVLNLLAKEKISSVERKGLFRRAPT